MNATKTIILLLLASGAAYIAYTLASQIPMPI